MRVVFMRIDVEAVGFFHLADGGEYGVFLVHGLFALLPPPPVYIIVEDGRKFVHCFGEGRSF